MAVTSDPIAINEWIVCAWDGQIPDGQRKDTALLGQSIRVSCAGPATYSITTLLDDGAPGRALPAVVKFGCVFTTLGTPTRAIPDIMEFSEDDRVFGNCGCVGVNTSPYRIIENFIDMAHFSFVHTDVLGVPDHTEVQRYRAEHREDVDEVWAYDCLYAQPTLARNPGTMQTPAIKTTLRNYRIMSPFSAVLYKPLHDGATRYNVTTIFLQPLDETSCLAYTPMAFVADKKAVPSLVAFQQAIFLQDRIILENQIPALLPLDPSYEIPTRADISSIAYRRWLKRMNMTFGTLEKRAV